MSIMYHDGNRQLQDRFESRRIADRLEEKLTRTAFSNEDKAFIESAAFFFIATADAQGRPDCSFKAGMPGFVRVTGACELAFPDYDGNGMFKSLGNLLVNPNIGLLFIAMSDKPKRLPSKANVLMNVKVVVAILLIAVMLVFAQAQSSSDHGDKLFAAACQLGLEGIVSKKLNAPYLSGPSRTWVKVKSESARRNPCYRRHFLISGQVPDIFVPC